MGAFTREPTAIRIASISDPRVSIASNGNGAYLSLIGAKIPSSAKAGIQGSDHYWWLWIPAFVGMTTILS